MNKRQEHGVIVVPFTWPLSHFVAGALVTLFVATWLDLPAFGASPLGFMAGAVVGGAALLLDFAVSRPIVTRLYRQATALQQDAILFIGIAALIAGQVVSSAAYW